MAHRRNFYDVLSDTQDQKCPVDMTDDTPWGDACEAAWGDVCETAYVAKKVPSVEHDACFTQHGPVEHDACFTPVTKKHISRKTSLPGSPGFVRKVAKKAITCKDWLAGNCPHAVDGDEHQKNASDGIYVHRLAHYKVV